MLSKRPNKANSADAKSRAADLRCSEETREEQTSEIPSLAGRDGTYFVTFRCLGA